MRIALVSPNTPREKGAGIEESVYYLGNFLQKKGAEVNVYCTAANPSNEVIEYNGLHLHEFPRFAPNYAYFFSLPLYHALKKESHDIIHCYGFNNMTSMLALLAKKENQKYILTGASSVSSSPLRKKLHAPLNWFYSFFGKKIDKLICVSDYECGLFHQTIKISPEKFVQIPNGINLEELIATKKKTIPHMILSVGRLVKQKGMHRLIAALPLILKKYPDSSLHVVGDGIEMENLRAQAKELGVENKVFFHGHISLEERPKLLNLYAQAQVFSLMADSESQGLVYGMAAAMDTPIITTNHSAMKDLIASHCAVGVNDPNNVQEIAQAIMGQFEKPLILPSRAEKERVLWSWERVGNAVWKVYVALLPQPSF